MYDNEPQQLFYQRQCLLAGDKYEKLKERIKNLFEAKGRRYGYRRIHALLVREEIRVFRKSHQAVHGKMFSDRLRQETAKIQRLPG